MGNDIDDIGKDILRVIRSGFSAEIKNDKSKLAKILTKAERGKANFYDISELSTQCGEVLSRLIAATVTPDKLPDGRLYYNIADTFLTGSLRDNYDLINVAAQAVQEQADKKIGVNLEPRKAEFPTERVQAIVNAAADETADWNTIRRRLDAPVRNVTESFYNDYVKENAEFRSAAGLKAYIIRETSGNCCEWCNALAGRYEYPNDVPPDVYARHDNCTCTVTHISAKGKQDVWSKKRYALSPEERKETLARTPKPERFTQQQAKEIEKSQLNGVVGGDNSAKVDLTNKDYDDILYMKGKMSNVDVRRWYVVHDRGILEFIDTTQPFEMQARQAHELRNRYKFQARELMKDQEARKQLDINYPLHDFEYYYSKYSKKYSSDEEIYKAILESSIRPNEKVNSQLGVK